MPGEHARPRCRQWGPAKDEFLDTGDWPHQLYVREARRMVSDYVMTEHNCRGQQKAEDPVGLGAYSMDSHNCQRIVKSGRAENEGDVQVPASRPTPSPIAPSCRRPPSAKTCWCRFACPPRHIAYGSIRMEPVFMILGQSAATAAALAMDGKSSVQKLRYEKLRTRLAADKQILQWNAAAPASPAKAKGAKR